MKPPVLILGAAGAFGTCLTEAVLESGRPVLAVDRDPDELERLTRHLAGRVPRGRVLTVAGSVADDAAAGHLAQVLRALPVPPLQALVNLQTPCARGRLLDQPPGFLEHVLHTELLPHLHAARRLLPVLAASGRCARYLVVGTPYAGTPWAGYGHYSIAAAAMRMLVQVLRQETADGPVRVQQLVIDAPVRSEDNIHCSCEEWPDALAVARHAAGVLADPDDTVTFIRFDPLRGTIPQATAEVSL